MPVLDISVIPVGTGDTSISDFIVESCKIIESENLKYQINPTGTVIEGDLPKLLNVVAKMHEAPFKMGAQRVITNIILDDRHDQEMNMEEQVQ